MRRLMLGISATVALVAGLTLVPSAYAQTLASQDFDRGPRFLLASAATSKLAPVDVTRTPILKRRLSLALDGATAKQALAEISIQSGLKLVYSDEILSTGSRVHLRTDGISVAAALTEVLLDANIDVVFESGMKAALVRRPPQPPIGAVVGRVTNAQSGEAIEAVEIYLQGTKWRTLSATDGQYRLADVDTGTYMITARRIGYTRQSRSVTVLEGQEAKADFALQPAVTKLDELVTTGTVIPTEERALPTPITVVSGEEIRAQQMRRIDEIFRGTVPGSVAWDMGTLNFTSSMRVRGATSFGDNAIKTYIDGVEVADPSYITNLDPNSIDRVEVIRGPQASTVYGSGAISGVMQIFTRRGGGTLGRPQIEASAALGGIQSDYADGLAARQDYSLAVSGGGPEMGYHFGGSYRDVGAWLPSFYSHDGAFNGGLHLSQGALSFEASARYALKRQADLDPPALGGYAQFAGPSYRTIRIQQQTYSLRATHSTRPSWRQAFTLGYDQTLAEQYNTQPRFRSPADSFLIVASTDQTKLSFAYNSSFTAQLTPALTSSLVVGADHYAFLGNSYFTGTATRNSGTIDGQTFAVNRLPYTDTGLFAQLQLGVAEALFVTGGVRGEWNDNFGDTYGAAVSPRVGVTYSHPVGPMTAKVRASYGEAIRAPTADQKVASVSPFSVQLANPFLGPERQVGGDVGLDLYLGSRASLGVTYYDQTVKDLIDAVRDPNATTFTIQWVNAGQIKNTGWELEGRLALGLVRLGGTFSVANSTVRALSPTYSGSYQVGDRVNSVPRYSGGATVTVTPTSRTTFTGALTHVGSWTDTDVVSLFGFFFGGQPYRGSGRAYWMHYPAFTKINLGVSQVVTPQLSAFAHVDNVGNVRALERNNLTVPMGRVTQVGAQVRY